MTFRRTTCISVGLVAFLVGLGVARIGDPIGFGWVCICLVCLLPFILRRNVVSLVAIATLGIVGGWWRGGVFMNRVAAYTQLVNHSVTVLVSAETDAVYVKGGQLGFDAGSIRLQQPYSAALPGRLKIQGFGEQAVNRGDTVMVTGRLYPSRGSRQATISFAELRIMQTGSSVVEAFRKKFVAGMQSALPEPQASFALGLLIGQRTTLPENVTSTLAAAGLTHIIAVSGYNLTIIVRAVRRIGHRRSKYQMMLASILLIVGFLLMTGFSASIVRAALVSGFSLWAWYYGRVFRPFLLLALVAALTAGWNPLYLWSDIGWYLSFLAFYGVIVLVPLLVQRIYGAKQPHPIKLLIYETIGAQVMTMPLILYIFEETSLVALVSNVLVVPLVPVAMLLSLAAGLGGMVVPAVAGWLALPALVVLMYMLEVVRLFAGLPHALIAYHLPLAGLVCMYMAVIFVSLVLWQKESINVRITDKEMINSDEGA